jgi:hypothetical protein
MKSRKSETFPPESFMVRYEGKRMTQRNQIKQPWLNLVRLVWIALAMNDLLPGLLGLPGYYHQLIALDPWPNILGWTQATFSAAVARTGLSPLVVVWIILVPALVKILVFLSLGLFIFWRKSNEWLGLLVSFVLVGLCGTFTGDRFQLLAALPPIWQVVANEVGTLGWLAFFIFLILFPEGRFAPHWMRWVAVGLAIWYVLTEAGTLILGQDSDWISYIGFILLALILIGKVYSFRHLSNLIERQQMRWFLFALMVFSVYATLQYIFVRVFPISPQPGSLEVLAYLIVIYLAAFTLLLIPIAIAIAIFRYRLWDIDLIIRRTLLYGALTATLGLVYFGSVLVLQQVFRTMTGQNSQVVVMLSTLVIAALFTPLRRLLQAVIDRRFFRQKYDAAHALAEFNSMASREVELEVLSSRLAAVAQESLQPESISLWLKKKELMQ